MYECGILVSEEMLAIRDTARKFAVDYLRPIGIELDALVHPELVFANDSRLWEAIAKYEELGFVDTYRGYSSDLSAQQNALLHCMVLEELSYGDVGLAITLGMYRRASLIASQFGNEPAAEYYAPRREVCCLAVTEPNHGSNQVAFTEEYFQKIGVKSDCYYEKIGDEYVVNGQKSSWVSAGTIAGAIILSAQERKAKSSIGDSAIFIVPADLPGISKGKPLNKIGQRPLNQGSIYFEDVRIPKIFLMAEGVDLYTLIWELFLKEANLAMAQQFVGVARAAYEYSLNYASARVQGGEPIIKHQNVKLQIFSMYSKLEACRSLVRRLSLNNVSNESGISFPEAANAKIFITQAASEICNAAIQVHGASGLCKEYPVEKLFRDARSSTIEDGENNILAIMSASRLSLN